MASPVRWVFELEPETVVLLGPGGELQLLQDGSIERYDVIQRKVLGATMVRESAASSTSRDTRQSLIVWNNHAQAIQWSPALKDPRSIPMEISQNEPKANLSGFMRKDDVTLVGWTRKGHILMWSL